ncbi:FAD dependent oxidoreductase superfamily [Myriangium duriaei CBS 260.36]|uniref:FAD dependent oxidoreductase superfamily n=1 Tax=Myriangium duriaei CBS 260.36 TaxID=1168546 RepID=A0A9P4IUY3_9PEZI|nr:FAD dependent oxidoreductase superfamily [Myriangium duriaei CBS 260.36]
MAPSALSNTNDERLAGLNIDASNLTPHHLAQETFWQRDRELERPLPCRDQVPTESDIVVIGAGFAGVSSVYHLVKQLKASGHLPKPRITLVEARDVCSGATGRNGGHIRPDMYGHIPKYVDRAGVKAGAEIAEFEIANLYAVKKLVEEENIDCDFTLCRSIDVWCNAEAAERARLVYDSMSSKDMPHMRDVFFVEGPAAEGYSGVKGAKAAASFTAGTMWPYKFIHAVLRPLLESGDVELVVRSPVLSVKTNSSTSYYPLTVVTSNGSIKAKKVVHASNAYVGGLLPEYAKNIVPCKGICCHIAVPDSLNHTAPLLNNSYINRTADNTLSYLIPRTDGSIVVGGAMAKFAAYREQWYNNIDDSCLIDAAKDYYEDYMQQTYRGWEDSGAKVTKIWTGVMGYSFDSNPHIGRVPDKDGQYIAAGFNGHGMPVVFLSAEGIAKMVLSDLSNSSKPLPFSETGIPRLFETSAFRIERAQKADEEHGDILGSGEAILPVGPMHNTEH